MKQREKIFNQFILDTLNNEECKNLQIVTKQDISKLVKKFEDSDIVHLSIDPDYIPQEFLLNDLSMDIPKSLMTS